MGCIFLLIASVIKVHNHKYFNLKTMKTFKSLFTLTFLSLLSFSLIADTSTVKLEKAVEHQIEDYVATLNPADFDQAATIYTNLLVKDADGFIHTVDFMIADEGEIIVLSDKLEIEYHRMENYKADFVEVFEVGLLEIEG